MPGLTQSHVTALRGFSCLNFEALEAGVDGAKGLKSVQIYEPSLYLLYIRFITTGLDKLLTAKLRRPKILSKQHTKHKIVSENI